MIQGLELDYCLDVFLKGLKEEVALEVQLYKPKKLTTMIKTVEEKNRPVANACNAVWGRVEGSIQTKVSARTGGGKHFINGFQ